MKTYFPMLKQWNLGYHFMDEIWKIKPKSIEEWELYIKTLDIPKQVQKHAKNALEYKRALGIIIKGTYTGWLAEKEFIRQYQANHILVRHKSIDQKGIDFIMINKETLIINFIQVKSTHNVELQCHSEPKWSTKLGTNIWTYKIYVPEKYIKKGWNYGN